MAFSNLEKAMALIIGLDLASPGFSRSAAKVAIRAIAPLATRTVAAGTGLAAANPVLAGTALGLGALQTQPGQQLLSDVSDIGRRDRIALENAIAQLTQVTLPKAKKRTKSKFNKMVSAGMKAVKASTSFGKKGTLSTPKKAFSAVTKAASAVTSGKKAPKAGIRARLMRIMRKIK